VETYEGSTLSLCSIYVNKHASVYRVWLPILIALLLAIGAYFYWTRTIASARVNPEQAKKGKGSNGGDQRGGPPATVGGIRARKGNIGVYVTGLGSVTPIYTVTVKSRVDGELMNVMYREGDTVHKGDLLVEIDPRPYQATLLQLQGELAKDQASLQNARLDLARYEQLLKQNAIPEQQVATQRATVSQDEGTVQADQGQIEGAKLNVIYTKITAPITGRIGLRLVDPGNIVHASDSTGLLVITQMDPISVIFTVAEDQLPEVLKRVRAGQMLIVDAFDRDMKQRLSTGTLTTIDNQIDQSTGAIRLRATFDNKNGSLFPNQFVNARLLLEEKRGVALLTSAALQRTSSSATFVYLVQPDNTVTMRNVTTGVTEGDDTEVTSGLKAGDAVVLTGADKLQEGSVVDLQIPGEAEHDAPAASKQKANAKGKGANRKGKNVPGNAAGPGSTDDANNNGNTGAKDKPKQ
jgi:multidrug efflux system membrane fusion protein